MMLITSSILQDCTDTTGQKEQFKHSKINSSQACAALTLISHSTFGTNYYHKLHLCFISLACLVSIPNYQAVMAHSIWKNTTSTTRNQSVIAPHWWGANHTGFKWNHFFSGMLWWGEKYFLMPLNAESGQNHSDHAFKNKLQGKN